MKIDYLSKTIILFLVLIAASPAMATTHPEIIREKNEARALQLNNRLEEIKAINKDDLPRAEKKALRREVREIKKELAAVSGGVYLSVGAILLIALLLILLL